MAKTQTRPTRRDPEPEQEETRRQDVAKLPTRGGPPAALSDRMRRDAGKGVSTDAADNLVPLIYLLQSNSPQTQNGHEKRIRGAEASDIWLRSNAPGDEIIKGEDGLLFQPCYFSKDWVEWMPNRGGFVGRHSERPEVAELRDVRGDDGSVRKRWLMPSGNVVVETRYHVGYAILPDGRALPYTIPLSSTGHTVSKTWMFQMNSEALPDGSRAPSFAILYRLRPKLQRKNQNAWYQYVVEKEGWVETEEEYERGLALHDAFASGSKEVAEETSDFTEGETGGEATEYDQEREEV